MTKIYPKKAKWQNLKARFYSILESQVFELKEKPSKVALGCAIGLGVNFAPTLGIGFLIAYLLALIFKVNRAGAAAISLLTGPLIPIMYAMNFVVGGMILTPVLVEETLWEFILRQYALILKLGNIEETIYGFLELLGSTFLLGAAINSAFFGTCFYFLVIYLLKKYKPGSQ
ncbi:MAG: DUF2062 domain-containing protein [Bacillota bacterium]